MKIYLAGVTAHRRDPEGIYHLESFFNFFTLKEYPVLKVGKGLLIDSGAFSFINAKAESIKNIDLNYYIDAYIDFLKIQETDYFFEMDIDAVKGLRFVEKTRNKIESKLGKPSIPVWHRSRGMDYFKGLCRDYNYIAIGGLAIKDIKRDEYQKLIPMVNYAHSHGCKIHGLGFTSLQWLSKIHWDSVDSTSWVNGNRFGHIFQFSNEQKRLIQIEKPEGVRIKKGKELDQRNFQEWLKFQRYAEFNL